jgi:hypothetical protein
VRAVVPRDESELSADQTAFPAWRVRQPVIAANCAPPSVALSRHWPESE